MTEALSDALENLSDNAVRLAYEVLDSETPYVRHVIALTAEDGLEVHTFDEEEQQPFPRRSSGNRTVAELDSFLQELNRRKLDERGTLWGNASGGKLVAIYNDHDPSPFVGGWRDDTLTLQLKQDPDWAQWHSLSGNYLLQQAFGDAVEELLHTVIEPDQADLLEIIDTVRASTKGEFESGINRANGAQKVTFHTEISTTAGRSTNQLEVPQFVKLRLRPWEGHPTFYDIDAYFRLKIDNGRLTLAIKLKPTRQIIREAWEEITATVTQAIDKPVYAQ
jgi:uncharacterized protein YfdQ (DUF2303 family)